MKLDSGREVEFKPWTIEQRVKVSDEIGVYYYKLGVDFTNADDVTRAPFAYEIALKAIKMAVKKVPADLTNNEIVELYNMISEVSHISELEKKS